jgi:DNA-binding MarR family transcriptional regulator
MARTQAQRATVETGSAAISDTLSLEGLDGHLSFHLKQAQSALHRDFLFALRDLDLTQKQYAVMALVSVNPACSQIALATTLGTDRATMMAIIDRLQKRAFLTRTPSRIDRRRQELNLTPYGGEVLDKARALVTAHEARLKALFSPKELSQLMSLLRRLGDTGGVDAG